MPYENRPQFTPIDSKPDCMVLICPQRCPLEGACESVNRYMRSNDERIRRAGELAHEALLKGFCIRDLEYSNGSCNKADSSFINSDHLDPRACLHTGATVVEQIVADNLAASQHF